MHGKFFSAGGKIVFFKFTSSINLLLIICKDPFSTKVSKWGFQDGCIPKYKVVIFDQFLSTETVDKVMDNFNIVI